MLVLAREVGRPPEAMVDPQHDEAAWLGLPVYKSDASALDSHEYDAAILAIDHPANRRRAFELYSRAGFAIENLVHSAPGEGTVHGDGLTLQRHAHLSVDCRLGRGIRLNVGANVMHDVVMGDFVTIAPNAVLLARVRIGDEVYVGANATILPDITVGDRSVIGAGAVVTRDVPAGAVVKGIPGRAG